MCSARGYGCLGTSKPLGSRAATLNPKPFRLQGSHEVNVSRAWEEAVCLRSGAYRVPGGTTTSEIQIR